jgi:diguanylate cyclase (GGDEF)-like protein
MSPPWIVLALSTVVLAIFLYGRERRARRRAAAHATELERTTHQAVQDLAVAVRLATTLSEVLDIESLKTTLRKELPLITGTEDFWVVAQIKEWTVLAGDPGDISGPLPSVVVAQPEAWECFPLGAAGRSSGLLGVKQPSAPLTDGQRELLGTVATLIGVAVRNIRRFSLARDLSMIDWLTRCLTRWHGVESLSREMRRQRRSRHSLCIAMLDLDHFKVINDTQGHHAGDRALAAVGRAMKESLRVSDIACRYGGDEFLLIFPETSIAGAMRAVENLRSRIEKTVETPPMDHEHLSASVGITEVDLDEEDPDVVIARADSALYEAKRAGRNRVAVSGPPSRPPSGAQPRPANPPNGMSPVS